MTIFIISGFVTVGAWVGMSRSWGRTYFVDTLREWTDNDD